MRRIGVVLLVLALLLQAGCSWRSKPKPPAPPVSTGDLPVAPAETAQIPDGPDLTAVAGPSDLSMDQLEAGLRRYLTVNKEAVPIALQTLYSRWNLRLPREGGVLLTEADLDGDGKAETITALNGGGQAAGITGQGTIFVIRRQAQGVEVFRMPEEFHGIVLHGALDLTGDNTPEILFSSTEAGAHTAHSRVLVARWTGSQFPAVGAEIGIATMRLTIEGRDLVIQGGLIGSVGAGEAQRERIERYRWQDGNFRLVDRQFRASEYGYHRLQDGILAEEFGRIADAQRAYTEAAEAGREAAPAIWLRPEAAGQFPDAVRTLARLRLAALLINQGKSAEAGQVAAAATGPYAGLLKGARVARQAFCQAAEGWATQNPAFLEALHSPMGYANPEWAPGDLCGPLPLSFL